MEFDPNILEEVLDRSINEVYIFNEDLKFEYVNKRAVANSGYSTEELYCMTPLDLKVEFSKEEFGELLKPVKGGKCQEQVFQTKHLRKDGTTYPVDVKIHYKRDPKNDSGLYTVVILDISEKQRLKGEAILKKNIVDETDDAIITKDLNGIVTFWNKAAEHIYGYKQEEIIGKSILAIIPDFLKEQEDFIISKIKLGEKIKHFETKRQTKSGDLIDVSVTISPISMDGEIIGASKISRNITEIKGYQSSLLESKRMFQLLVENSKEVITKMDPVGTVIYVSPSVKEVLGYEPDELIGRKTDVFYHPEDIERIVKEAKSNSLEGQKVTGAVYRFKSKNGDFKWLNSSSKPIFNEDGSLDSTIVHSRDITESEESRKKLVESQQMLVSIANSIPGLVMRYIVKTDGAFEVQFISKGGEALYEIPQEDLEQDSSKVFSKVHPDDISGFTQKIDEAVEGFCMWGHEFRVVMDDGRIKWISAVAHPEKLSDGNVLWQSLALDVTDRKVAEMQNLKLLAQIEKALEEKEMLFKELHHRVKNNLQLINSLMYIKAIGEKNERLKEFISDTTTRINSIAKIHEHLLNEDAIGHVNAKLYCQELIRSLIKAHVQDGSFGLDISVEEIYLEIDDMMKIGLILNELTLNIIKYAYPESDKGKIIINLFHNGQLNLIVADEGIGNKSESFDSSFGIQMIQLLTEDLRGTFDMNNKDGTKYHFRFDVKTKNTHS